MDGDATVVLGLEEPEEVIHFLDRSGGARVIATAGDRQQPGEGGSKRPSRSGVDKLVGTSLAVRSLQSYGWLKGDLCRILESARKSGSVATSAESRQRTSSIASPRARRHDGFASCTI